MNFIEEPNRIYLLDEASNITAEVTFPACSEGVVSIDHTFVDASLRGQGVAGQLLEAVALKLRREKKQARPVCSFAVSWFEKHPEFSDLLTK